MAKRALILISIALRSLFKYSVPPFVRDLVAGSDAEQLNALRHLLKLTRELNKITKELGKSLNQVIDSGKQLVELAKELAEFGFVLWALFTAHEWTKGAEKIYATSPESWQGQVFTATIAVAGIYAVVRHLRR